MSVEEQILTVAALAAEGDETAAVVLLDLLLEHPKQTAWRDERVMMLCLGVPLDSRPPAHLGEQGKRNWRAQRYESIAFAERQWDLYAGRADHQRAMIAVVLFSEWTPQRGTSNASPWAVARRSDPEHQARLAEARARRRRYRARRDGTMVNDHFADRNASMVAAGANWALPAEDV